MMFASALHVRLVNSIIRILKRFVNKKKEGDETMFIIDENQNIHLSRGDKMNFDVEFVDVETDEKYIFQDGDKLTFTVAKNLRKNYITQVTKYISGPTESVNFEITDTLWLNECAYVQEFEYDVILNDKFSVICYDLDGAKKLFLYPRTYEGGVE